MNSEQTQEKWQVDARGKIWDTNFAEITSWIDQGALLRQDKVRKGNLRWIEACKVPSLLVVFNAKDNGQSLPPPTVTMTKLGPTSIPGDSSTNPPNFTPQYSDPIVDTPVIPDVSGEPVCNLHTDIPARYVCGTCASLFCKACPNSYGGTVKICPFCGAMCNPIELVEKQLDQAAFRSEAIGSGFGFADFGKALVYPFQFKASLIFGAVMFMFFTLGQSAVSFGGIFMLGGAIFSFMLANTLTFGVLANTVENFAQGKIGDNFMPGFDDFSVWEDVVHPFFLSIGVYISSFGPLIAIVLVATFMIIGTMTKEMNGLQSDAARTVNPGLAYAANAAEQSEKVKEILRKRAEDQKRRVEAFEKGATDGTLPPDEMANHQDNPDLSANPPVMTDASEMDVDKVNQMIQQQRKAQLESAIGKSPETIAKERTEIIQKVLGFGILFILAAGLCLVWGLFYFPAACAVAGYTRSFTATLNPSVGFDTIRRLGFNYFKIMLMCLVLIVASIVVNMVLGAIFGAFDMPGVGNLPARAIGALFGFYISVVFSCVLGFALFKSADRLRLPGTE